MNQHFSKVDLGSGRGFDCFLAANEVGKNSKVIGVDMTPDMISKARKSAQDADIEIGYPPLHPAIHLSMYRPMERDGVVITAIRSKYQLIKFM